MKDLTCLFNTINKSSISESILNYYKKFGEDDQAKCVTMIWTSDRLITKLINCALVVDAINQYGYDKNLFQFYFEQLDKLSIGYKFVISKFIKIIRILNSFIVDKGTSFNDSDRVTYRGIHKDILKNVKVGQTFRVVNWM